MAVADRGEGESGGLGGYFLTGITVNTVTRHSDETFNQRRAVNPFREEGADHGVADLELADTGANSNHFARAVGHRDALFSRAPHAAHDCEVMVVQ